MIDWKKHSVQRKIHHFVAFCRKLESYGYTIANSHVYMPKTFGKPDNRPIGKITSVGFIPTVNA